MWLSEVTKALRYNHLDSFLAHIFTVIVVWTDKAISVVIKAMRKIFTLNVYPISPMLGLYKVLCSHNGTGTSSSEWEQMTLNNRNESMTSK